MKFKDKIVVVTGASSGIGEMIARRFGNESAHVVLVARREQNLKRITTRVNAGEGSGEYIVADVTVVGQVENIVGQVLKRHGKIDVWINNAGAAESAPLKKTDEALWDRMMNTNARSAFLCTKAVAPSMMERQYGRIINNASITGKVGGAYITAYSASKHAVVGFTRSAAIELQPYGVTVNAVCPGFVDSPMTERTIKNIREKTGKTLEEARRVIGEMNPQKRLIQPDEVANVMIYLASDEAAAITGQAVEI